MIRKILLTTCALGLLSSCTVPPPTSGSLVTALTNLANTGVADFNNVINVANAATPPDVDAVPCAQAGITVVQAMQKVLAATPAGSTVGVFTAAEIASLYQPGSAQTNFVVKTIETGCVAKIHDTIQAQQSMVGALATLSAVLAAAG